MYIFRKCPCTSSISSYLRICPSFLAFCIFWLKFCPCSRGLVLYFHFLKLRHKINILKYISCIDLACYCSPSIITILKSFKMKSSAVISSSWLTVLEQSRPGKLVGFQRRYLLKEFSKNTIFSNSYNLPSQSGIQ